MYEEEGHKNCHAQTIEGKLYFGTAQMGGYFVANELGQITYDRDRLNSNWKQSGKWIVLGVIYDTYHAPSQYIRFGDLPKWLETKPEFKFKNGKPRCHIVDLDHDTKRIWGAGLTYMYLEKTDAESNS